MVSIEELKIGTVIGTVFINSTVNARAINSPSLVALQYEIFPSRYKFLRWQSYVDCSDLKDRMQSSFLQEINASGRILGTIANDDLSAIIQLVSNAETIPSYYKSLCNIIQRVA
jgi:hypothetical protein